MSNLADRQSCPKVFATGIDTDAALVSAIRARLDALNVPHSVIEALAGIPSGYLSKVCAVPPPKRMGAYTMFLILSALGLTVSLSEDPALMEWLGPRYQKRQLGRSHSGNDAEQPAA